MNIARSELILGGQKSGKSRRAESLARAWLARSSAHRAVLIATASAHDEEMRARIARHQHERAERAPGMATVEAARDTAQALARHGAAHTLVVVDCLTLGLTAWLMPAEGEKNPPQTPEWQAQADHFFQALAACPGPVVLVGNEIGLGVIPLGAQARAFVDALGLLNQRAAAVCQRVTLMAAGLPLTLKDEA